MAKSAKQKDDDSYSENYLVKMPIESVGHDDNAKKPTNIGMKTYQKTDGDFAKQSAMERRLYKQRGDNHG